MLPKPKRPAAVWIALAIMFLFGVVLVVATSFNLYGLAHENVGGQVARRVFRIVTYIPAFVCCVLTIFAVIRRKKWGRWLPIVPMIVLIVQITIQISSLSPWFYTRPLRVAALVMTYLIVISPMLSVILLLSLGSKVNDYFAASSYAAESGLFEPPPPPIFEEN